jgi:maleate cis-trans isomerase
MQAPARRPLGILMLEGKMADVPGCMACEATFDYPVVRQIVRGSRTPLSAAEAWSMLPLYIDAARALEGRGVAAITANCGLIALMQKELAAAVRVPVVTSALLMVPDLHRLLGGRRIGILTFFTSALSERNYNASGWSSRDFPIALGGVGEHESWLTFLRTKEVPPELRERMTADLLAVVRGMLAEHPDIGAFVSECTMLPACLQAVRDAIGLPVYDVLTQLDLAMSGSWRPAGRRMGGNGRGAGGEGPRLGVLLLDGKMAQVPGAMASPATFPYPVVHRVVQGSRPPVSAADAESLLPLYVEAARELARQGVAALTENCNGQMIHLQQRLAATVQIPVVTSALFLVPQIHRMMPSRRLGILAFHPEAVTDEVIDACGWSAREIRVAVGGVADSAAWREFLRTKEIPERLRPRLESDLVALGRRMLAEHPDLGAFVAECTLLPPATQALRDALGLPVFDILNALDLTVAGRFRPPDVQSDRAC